MGGIFRRADWTIVSIDEQHAQGCLRSRGNLLLIGQAIALDT